MQDIFGFLSASHWLAILRIAVGLWWIKSVLHKPLRKFIDGGMTDNPRPILYNAKYEAVILDKIDTTSKEIVTIAGKCCESGDILIRNLKLPIASLGDLLVVFSTGAYHHSMASNYNGLTKPAVVLVLAG